MLTLQTFFTPKDEISRAWVNKIIDQLDKRTNTYKTKGLALVSVLSALVAYQSTDGFEVNKKQLNPDEREAWDLLRDSLTGTLLQRSGGRNVYRIKQGTIPHDVSVVTTGKRDLSFGSQGQGVLFTNREQLIPDLVRVICGVHAAVVDLKDPDVAFQNLLNQGAFPRRWIDGTDLGVISVTDGAISLADSFCEYLNDTFTRSGYIMVFQRSEGRITLVCAADITPRLLDSFANYTLRFFRNHGLPQIILPMHIKTAAKNTVIQGVPLTQERNHSSERAYA